MWRLIQTSPPTIESGGRAGGGDNQKKKTKHGHQGADHLPPAGPAAQNATGKCCEINSHSAFKSERSAAAAEEKTDEAPIARKVAPS